MYMHITYALIKKKRPYIWNRKPRTFQILNVSQTWKSNLHSKNTNLSRLSSLPGCVYHSFIFYVDFLYFKYWFIWNLRRQCFLFSSFFVAKSTALCELAAVKHSINSLQSYFGKPQTSAVRASCPCTRLCQHIFEYRSILGIQKNMSGGIHNVLTSSQPSFT